MQLSVIVPCYDIEDYVDRCLASLRDQDLGAGEYEIIVVDDGSTDGTSRLVRAHEHDDARVVVIRQENRGLSAARNAGLERATGTFVYFVDGDDYVASESLPPVVEAMQREDLDMGWVDTQWLQPGDAPEAHDRPDDVPKVDGVVDGMEYWTAHEWKTNVWLYMLRRSFLERTGRRFEEGMVIEDRPFTYNVLADAARVAAVHQDVYRYMSRPGSIMRDTSQEGNRRALSGLRRAIESLDELEERKLDEGLADPAFLARLTSLQQSTSFFVITRAIRSREPLGPTLAELEAAGHYPLRAFPDEEHDSLPYQLMTRIYNHRLLLYPFAFVVGAAYRARSSVARARTRA